ncbi:MAG: hypothetical protein R3Y22_02665 [Bacteroidales bacterium]
MQIEYQNSCLKKFLRSMKIGDIVMIPDRMKSYNTINSRICELRREGYAFIISCKGLIDATKIVKLG